jgi:hypothetical protein
MGCTCDRQHRVVVDGTNAAWLPATLIVVPSAM